MNNNKRKSSRGPVRSPRVRNVMAEGVYNNAHFMHAATSHVGNVVRIYTASGSVWEGVFRTFSSQFEVVLEVAAKVENPDTNNSSLAPDSLVDKLIFKVCDIISMVARDVDLEYATRDTFQTDTAISAKFNGQQKNVEEKELEPWDPSTGVNGGETSLELEPGANGWDVNDMFRRNEQVYGVTSTYDQSLAGYTVQLQHTDSPDYREQEAKAEQIANEIESQPNHKARSDLENGDEEERFAAVIRPNTQHSQDTNYSKPGLDTASSGGKYVPPAKRKNQISGKLMRSTPPPSQGGSAQTTPSPKGNPPPMQYPTHPSPHSNTPNTAPHIRESQSSRDMPRDGTHNLHGVHVHNINPPHAPQNAIHSPHNPPINTQHPIPNHAPPPHNSTPPHNFNPPLQRPGLPPNGGPNTPKPQLNGEAKPVQQRNSRNNYPPNSNMPPQGAYVEQQPKPDGINRGPRHREEVKELQKFGHEFKLAPSPVDQTVSPNQMPEQLPPPPPKSHPAQQATPPQPQQSVSPQQENIDKVSNTLKKSTLNPNAKEFVMNPAAKVFTPRYVCRSPSTPSASRPHTPQTPSHSPYIPATIGGPPGQQSMPVMMSMGYMVTSQPQYQPQHHPQNSRLRKVPMGHVRADVASQMQVAAATGQPLLAPAPIQQFVYPPGLNPQAYQQMHAAVRMYESPQQIQYIQSNPSNTPSPAQQPSPYSQSQGPQPPPQQYQAPPPQGPPQFPIMCPIIPTQPHMMQTGMHYIQQPPPPQGPLQVILPPPPQPQQHAQAP